MANLPNGHPGCLVATYCYRGRLLDREVRELNQRIVLIWRARFREMFESICTRYEPREPVDLDDLAGMVSAIVEGGMVLGRAVGRPDILPRQIMLFRSYIKLLFEPRAVQ